VSVINKMLRDLDQRQDANTPAADAQSADQTALRQGTASVSFGDSAANQALGTRSRMGMALAVLATAVLATGAWFWWQGHGGDPRTLMTTRVATTAPAPAASTLASTGAVNAVASTATVAAPTESAPEPVAERTAAPAVTSAAGPTTPVIVENTPATTMALRMETSLSTRRVLDALLSAPASAVARPANPAPTSASIASAPASAPAATTSVAVLERPTKPRPAVTPSVPPTTTPPPAGDSAPAIQRQQQAGGDAMAQAQTLWNSGSRDAAIDLMQQSIAAAERSAKAGVSPGGSAVLVTLVREMTRMQLAEARFGAVWEMLTRLDPLLGNQPDLWAIRANAAQRLGRHQDSVHAYMMALQSRPNEQRWLLGSAVSLAALGQTSAAAEMAEKARAVGPVSRDVLAYLRQTGVPLKE